MAAEADKEFLTSLVKAIVDHPDEVSVERKIDEMGVLLSHQGSTAKAIRTLLRIVGVKNNARVNLKIEEPERSTEGQSAE